VAIVQDCTSRLEKTSTPKPAFAGVVVVHRWREVTWFYDDLNLRVTFRRSTHCNSFGLHCFIEFGLFYRFELGCLTLGGFVFCVNACLNRLVHHLILSSNHNPIVELLPDHFLLLLTNEKSDRGFRS
jgi:hypothetical protein